MPPLREPLEPAAAKRLIRKIIQLGTVTFSKHTLEEMANDDLSTADCVTVLRARVVQPGEFELGSWRYRVSSAQMCVVVAFRSEEELVVVTAWRTE